MRTNRVYASALVATLIFVLSAGSPATASGSPSCFETPLIAGQHEVIGSVLVDDNGSNVYVTYRITEPGWYMTGSHLYIGLTPPAKAAPGSFPYKHSHDGVTEYTYCIPLSSIAGYSAGDCLVIAAHADVKCAATEGVADLDAFCASLPTDPVDMVLTRDAPWAGQSYWNSIISGAGALDGIYASWCIDADSYAALDYLRPALMFCTYDPAFASLGMVEKPENMDVVSYILNQSYVGQIAADGAPITFGDVQKAIWTLVDDNLPSALSPMEQRHVDEILDDALLNGVGFVPGCGELVGVAVQPIHPVTGDWQYQAVILGIPLPCTTSECEETAWGAGNPEDQFKQGWGWTFEYCGCP